MHQNNSDSSSEKEHKGIRMTVILILTVFSFSNGFFTMLFIVEFTMTLTYSFGEKLYKTIKDYIQIDYNEQLLRVPSDFTFMCT